jgi:glycosyltransferase involved in cell wall biosynthesis
MPSAQVFFWQRIMTPHMGALAAKLCAHGFEVTFVSNDCLSEDRERLGWQTPDFGRAAIRMASNQREVERIVASAPDYSIHVYQGLRGNGLVGHAQRLLRSRTNIHHWAVLETVDDQGWRGIAKRAGYRRLFSRWAPVLDGILAIGRRCPRWVSERGFPSSKIYPFAYFLDVVTTDLGIQDLSSDVIKRPFRFIFVGQLIPRKRVADLLAIFASPQMAESELWIVGDGSEAPRLRLLADQLALGNVKWFGVQPISSIPQIIGEVDCLVLPSRHDGWGAVISEALLVGTPVVCSDSCGASEVVHASGAGTVVSGFDFDVWRDALYKQVMRGKWSASERRNLRNWAECISAESGARYLAMIFEDSTSTRPNPPWQARTFNVLDEVVFDAD